MHISVFSRQKLELILSACPFCGSEDIVKHGTCAGHQRYLCKRCRHSFVSRYGSMAYRSKQKPCKIKSRAKAFIDKLSLRSIADLFHVNKNTVLLWRKKFLLAACGRSADTKLFGRVEIDGKYVNVSRSRYRKTGTGRKFRGLSVNKVALVIGCDSHNRHVFFRLERGRPSGNRQTLFREGRIGKGSTLVYDGDVSHRNLVRCLSLKDECHRMAKEKDSPSALQQVNNDCSFISLYLAQHPGI